MGDPIQPEDWNSRSHQSIYSTAQAFDTGKPAALAGAYRDTGTNLHEEATVMGRKVQLAVAEHWRGQAAQAMQSAYGEFFKDVDGYVTKLFAMAGALPPVGSAMDTSKANIQPPMSAQTTTMGRTMGLSDAELKQKAAEDEKYARWQMSNLFSQPVVSAGSGADIANTAAEGPSGGGTGGATPGGGTGGATGMSGGGGKPQSPAGADGLADRNTRPQLAGGEGQQAGQGGGSGSGGGAPGGGSPSGAGLGGLGSGSDRSGYGTSGLVPGSTQAAFHQPPTGAPGSASSGPGVPRPGFGGVLGAAPGTGGGANPAGISASGVRGAGGPLGMGPVGMAGAGAHGKGGKRDDDDEHAIPEMLRNLDNSEEFFGEPRKFVPGGVVGDFKAMAEVDKQRKEAEKRRYRSLGWDVKFDDEDDEGGRA